MSTQDPERTINSNPSHNPRWAVADARNRSNDAFNACRDFFGSRQHQRKIAAVQDIVNGFFRVKKGVYVNHRENRGRPFTTVKVDDPVFPNVGRRKKNEQFYDPLTALGVEIIRSTRTNSYILHVR